MDRAAKNPIVGSKIVPERVCGRSVDPSDVNVICGKPAIRHVFWNPEPEGWAHNFVCAEHLTEARTYRPMYEHPLGAYCGMPGSLFFAEEKACRTPDGAMTDATGSRAADFYCAVLRCRYCDRIPPHHRCVESVYYCDDDPASWAGIGTMPDDATRSQAGSRAAIHAETQATGSFWLDGGYDRDAVEACPYHPLHKWWMFRLGDVLKPGTMRDPDEMMVICQGCYVPRCGHTTEPDPCMLPRHHREPHSFLSGRHVEVGA